jgi:hypothetical protein
MNDLIITLAITAAQMVAQAVDAIIESTTMTAEEKRAALEALEAKLEVTKARVAAVRFKDV